MTPVKMTPVYNLRNKKAGMPRSSPDPRSRAVKRRLLENKQRKKEKKCKLGKIMEETEPKKKMTEEISHSSDSENDKQKKPLSAKKQKMNKVNATPSNKNLRGKKAELSSEENIDTSSNSDGHEYNKEACEKISSPQIENISDDNASSSSLNPESYTEYDCDRENECSYSSPEQVREDDSASSSSLNHESYEEYDCDREKECSYSSPEQVREDSQIEFREAAFVQEKQVRKNSTLMDISRAQAINEMPEPFNIYNISPISEECIGESKKCLPDQLKTFDPIAFLVPGLIREASHPEDRISSMIQLEHLRKDCAATSNLVSGKQLRKIMKIDLKNHAYPRTCVSATSQAKLPDEPECSYKVSATQKQV